MTIDPASQSALMAMADILIPAHKEMPAFSAVCDGEAVGRSVGFRPDLRDAFVRALDTADLSGGAEIALEQMNAGDKDAFSALGLIVIATYYMQPRVRELIGYPGQENVAYDNRETQPYLLNGMLGRVMGRGRKYRPTPDMAVQA